MKIVAILQARMGSTRLPGKILLPLAGKSMLQNIIERVQRATLLNDVMVAVPYDSHVNQLESCLPSATHYYPHTGDEADLVGRFSAAAQVSQADLIVRVPCDNPCIDPAYIDAAIESYLLYPFIYYSNTTAEVAGGMMVDGIGAEVVSRSRLQWLDQRTKGHPVWREHPHKYFEECGLLQLPPAQIRLDVNTQADYEFIADIYEHFGHNHFTSEQAVGYLAMKGR